MITQFLSILMLTASVGASASADGLGVFNPETPSASITTANIYAFYGNYEFRYTPSVNLFDKDHKHNAMINYTTGELVSSDESVWTSNFIPVKASTNYKNNLVLGWSGYYGSVAYYDQNQTYLGGLRGNTTEINQFTTPSNCAYLRLSGYNVVNEPEFYSNPSTTMLVEGSVLPNSYVAYSCSFEVNTPYHDQVFDCYFDDSTLGMTSNSWSDAQFSVGYGYMHFEFDGNSSLLQAFANEFTEGVQSYHARFDNMDFEPNSEDDYEVGIPIGDIRLSAYAFFNVANTRYACDLSFTGCYSASIEEGDPVISGSGYTPVPYVSFDYEFPSNPYVVKVVADDGYYLADYNTSAQMVIGGNCTIVGVQASEAYPNTGNNLIKSVYVFFQVPLNVDCNITFTALARPTHSVVLQLNDATGEYLSGNGTFYEGEGFVVELTADDGHGFNSQTNSIFVYGASEYHVLYVEPLVGSLHKSVMVEITGGSSNITINATALPYTQDYASGFDNGRVDGMNNASMFAWIKTVFDGMASFFNITILPGVSLGFLAFGPLIVVAIVAIVRIIKHD